MPAFPPFVCAHTQARQLHRHTTGYNVKVAKFSAFEDDHFMTCGRDSIRCYRLRRGELKGMSIHMQVGRAALALQLCRSPTCLPPPLAGAWFQKLQPAAAGFRPFQMHARHRLTHAPKPMRLHRCQTSTAASRAQQRWPPLWAQTCSPTWHTRPAALYASSPIDMYLWRALRVQCSRSTTTGQWGQGVRGRKHVAAALQYVACAVDTHCVCWLLAMH